MTASTTTALAYAEDVEVKEVAVQARTIADEAKALEVVDEASNTLALTMLSECKKATRRMDDLRRRFVDPLNAHVKDINAFFRENAAPADEAASVLSRKTADYRFKVQEAARKENERQRQLAEARQQRAAEKAEAKGEEAPPVLPVVPTVQAPAKTVQTDTGSSVTFRKVARFEIVDAAKVPDEFKTVDEVKIGAAVRAGIYTPDNPIPGVLIWIDEVPTVRG